MQVTAALPFKILTPARIVMAAVYLGAIVAGWVMLPGDGERVAMLERDGHFRNALSILESRYQQGDRSYRTINRLEALYENEGDAAKSGAMLQQLAALSPRDAAAQRRLADYYRNTQNGEGYVTALKAQVEIRYSEAACRELASRLRLAGDYSGELSSLQTCRQLGFRRADDMLRLASLLAASGDVVQAVALLRSIDDVKRLKDQRDRYQLLELLLEQDQPKEAERRALRWVRAQKDDPAFAVGIADIFARSKYPDSAVEFAKDAGSPGDSISLTVAERLLEQTKFDLAKLYLRGWLKSAAFEDRDTAIRFTEAAISAGDPETAFAAGRRFGFELLPSDQLGRLANALDGAQMSANAEEVRSAAARVELSPAKVPEASKATDAQLPRQGASSPPDPDASKVSEPRRQVQIDALEKWRRALATRMSDDAQRRLQVEQVGPIVPRGYRRSGHHLGSAHHESRVLGNARILKKTAKVLQRAKKNRLLRLHGRRANATPQGASPSAGAAQSQVAKGQPEKPATRGKAGKQWEVP